jgi:8-oxo-dGTP pyrophosphatase MutT (NUDIX family)
LKKKQSAKRNDLPRSQIAALPVYRDESGAAWVLLITSRETRRWIIPKGWPMRGRKDHDAAAQEAFEEAGVVGRVSTKPVGTYLYWKRQTEHFELCNVKVYLLEVEGQLEAWPEKGQRRTEWFSVGDAAARIEDPGLSDLIQNLALTEVSPAVR